MIQDTATNLRANNPVIPSGEIAAESDTGIFKIGDGIRRYNELDVAGRDNMGRLNVVREKLILFVGGPVAKTGTVSVSGTTATGVGTAFQTWFSYGSGYLGIMYNDGTEENPEWATNWAVVDSVTSDTVLTLASSDLDGFDGIPAIPGGGSDSNSGTSPDAPLATWAALSARLSAIDLFYGEVIGIVVQAPTTDAIASVYAPDCCIVAIQGSWLPRLHILACGCVVTVQANNSGNISVMGPSSFIFMIAKVEGAISAESGAVASIQAMDIEGVTAGIGGTIHLMSECATTVKQPAGGVVMYSGVYGTYTPT